MARTHPDRILASLAEAGGARWWWLVLAVLAIGSLTISATVLSIVGTAPSFFVAKGMTAGDILLVAVGVVVGPLMLAFPVVVARLHSPTAAGIVLSLTLGGLVAVLVGHVLDGLDQTGEVVVVVSGLVGLLVAGLYGLTESGRTLVRLLSPAPLVVLGLFIFASPSSALLTAPQGDAPATALRGGTDVPVVVLVVDELPLATVANSSGEFLHSAFPGIGQLVEDGVWYRNAVSNSRSTTHAIPSLATGLLPDTHLLPIASDHPNSLLSALRHTHDVRGIEPLSALCPERVCTREERTDLWGSTVSDLAVIVAHIVLPNALAAELPSIDETWGDFAEDERTSDGPSPTQSTMKFDPRIAFDHIRKAITPLGGRPPFVFGHVVLPHIPWHFLDDGTRITGGEKGYLDGIVLDDPWPVALGLQRHLLVAQYVDDELARIFESIKDAGWYDEALIVLVSDHGVSFESGYHRRDIVVENLDSIAPVPMIVKYPASLGKAPEPGSVDDLRAESIDLAATVFDVLDLGVPYRVDGLSLLDTTSRAERTLTPIFDAQERFEYPTDLAPALATAELFDEWFPHRDPWELRLPGLTEEMWMTPNSIVDDPGIRLEMENPARFEDVDLEAEPLPVVVYALASGVEPRTPVGVIVNGEVAVVTATYRKGEAVATGAVLPPLSLRPGANEVGFVVLDESGQARN